MPEYNDNIFDLYKSSIEEEHYFLSAHQDRINFFIGILSALIGGTIAGLFKSVYRYHYALMAIGPVMIIVVCSIASRGVSRLYQRFLEAITVRSKLEKEFGLMTERLEGGKGHWIDYEPIITKRHIDSNIEEGKKYNNSKEWVDAHMEKKESYHGVVTDLFNKTKILGYVLLGIILYLAYKS